ncbi:hypothetical protein [Haloplanus natans]|uniref:hypothetical protein n=1 Tax=Haloplanus natans TaxID=376171 RepID=UPI0006782A32|nr:hypothetical protein [Haloplanus natans]
MTDRTRLFDRDDLLTAADLEMIHREAEVRVETNPDANAVMIGMHVMGGWTWTLLPPEAARQFGDAVLSGADELTNQAEPEPAADD